jgi:hypothetical protein
MELVDRRHLYTSKVDLIISPTLLYSINITVLAYLSRHAVPLPFKQWRESLRE